MGFLPFDSNVTKIFRNNRRSYQRPFIELDALVGNGSGVILVPGYNGNRIWVRLTGNTNDDALVVPQAPVEARLTGSNFHVYEGAPIRVKYGKDGLYEVIGPDPVGVENSGKKLSMMTLNTGDQQRKWLNLNYVLRLLSRPVATKSTSSTLVSVAQFIYFYYGSYNFFGGTPLQADKIDLASYIPTSGNHRIVQLWLDTFNNSIQVTASTTQAMTTDFDSTDYAELLTGVYQDWLPIQSYILKDGQTSITNKDLYLDFRQWLNMAEEIGNEFVLSMSYNLRSNREYRVHSLDLNGKTFALNGGILHLSGGAAGGGGGSDSLVEIDSTDSPYSIADTDINLICDTSGGNITVTLPASISSNRKFRIKNTGSGTVTVAGNGNTIDGVSSQDVSLYNAMFIIGQSSEWSIV